MRNYSCAVLLGSCVFAVLLQAAESPIGEGAGLTNVQLRNLASCDVLTVEPGSMPWTTVHTRIVPLPVDWPEGATSAMLTTTDIQGNTIRTETVAAGVESVDWTAFEGEVPRADALYTVTLSFRNGSRVVSTESSQLAVLRGAFAGIDVLGNTAAREWKTVDAKGFFVGSDSSWVNGTGPCVVTPTQNDVPLSSQTSVSASGWAAFVPQKPAWSNQDPFSLTVAFGGTDETLDAELRFLVSGLVLILK